MFISTVSIITRLTRLQKCYRRRIAMIYEPRLTYKRFAEYFPTENSAIDLLKENMSVYCPNCMSAQVYSTRPNKPFMVRCKDCKQEFSMLQDTIFSKSRADFRLWLYLMFTCCEMYEMAIDEEHLNLCQLKRDFGNVSPKTLKQVYYKLCKWCEEDSESPTRRRIVEALSRRIHTANPMYPTVKFSIQTPRNR